MRVAWWCVSGRGVAGCGGGGTPAHTHRQPGKPTHHTAISSSQCQGNYVVLIVLITPDRRHNKCVCEWILSSVRSAQGYLWDRELVNRESSQGIYCRWFKTNKTEQMFYRQARSICEILTKSPFGGENKWTKLYCRECQ